MQLIVVSGLSGSGKSVALGMLEDMGFYCIDNLPMGWLRNLSADTLRNHDKHFNRLAIGIDARSRADDIAHFSNHVRALKGAGLAVQVLFLHADEQVIYKRYSETRRKHPLTDDHTSLVDAVAADRELLTPIAEQADLAIDTSQTNVHQLREAIRTQVGASAGLGLSILLQSFGFKHGVPESVDFVFDVRCLPNPHWVESLRDKTGRDPAVAAWLEDSQDTGNMLHDIGHFLTKWLPAFQRENRAYISVAIGCTGGKHRSVYLVECLAEQLRRHYPHVLVRHSELS